MNPTIVGDSQEYCRVTYRVLPELSLNGEMVLARTFCSFDGKNVQQGFRQDGET